MAMDQLTTSIGVAPFAIAGSAFFLGIVIGWFFWGGQSGEAAADKTAGAMSEAQLAALEQALASAKADLAKLSENDPAKTARDELMRTDAAIKRANGRLKLLLRAVDQASR